MLALTIRFCFPPTSSSRRGSGRACVDVFSPQKGYRTALAHLGDPQVEAAIADSSRSSSGEAVRPFGKNRRHPRPKTPNGRSTRKVFEKQFAKLHDILRQRFVCSLSASCTIRGRQDLSRREKVLRSRSKKRRGEVSPGSGVPLARTWRIAPRAFQMEDGNVWRQMVRMLRAVDMLCTATGVTKEMAERLEVDKRTVDRLLGVLQDLN